MLTKFKEQSFLKHRLKPALLQDIYSSI